MISKSKSKIGHVQTVIAWYFRLSLKRHHAADRLALVHEVERLVDVGERHHMRDHRVDLDLALHVPVDNFRHVGAAPRAAERGPLPRPARNELKRARRNLGAGGRNPDDDRLSPTAMTGFQRLSHDSDVAGTV